MKKYLFHIVIALSLGGLSACASTGDAEAEAVPERTAGGSDCISQSSVRDYRVLDDANLIVTAGVSRHYHLLLARPAYGLRSSWQIGFRSATGRICGGFDELVVDGGFGPERYRIVSISRLAPEDEEALLVRFGKKKPATDAAPATQDPAGAEVEELD